MNKTNENERIENAVRETSSMEQPSNLYELDQIWQQKLSILRKLHHDAFMKMINNRKECSRTTKEFIEKCKNTIKEMEHKIEVEQNDHIEDLIYLKTDYEESCFQFREEKDYINAWMKQQRDRILQEGGLK